MQQRTNTAKYVPGTGRERMNMVDGVELQRAYVYLLDPTWEKLRELGKRYNVSDSMIIEELVNIASSTTIGL